MALQSRKQESQGDTAGFIQVEVYYLKCARLKIKGTLSMNRLTLVLEDRPNFAMRLICYLTNTRNITEQLSGNCPTVPLRCEIFHLRTLQTASLQSGCSV